MLRYFACVALVSLSAGLVEAADPRAIAELMIARDDGDNMVANMRMTLVDSSGHERVRTIRSHSKKRGADNLKLMFFAEPADVKNTGLLTVDYADGARDDQWLYLPAMRKTKRIASSDQSSPFMGSDFSYADMTRPILDEWTYRLLKESEVRGEPVWLIEALPTDRSVVERYGYTRSIWFIRQDNFMLVRAIHWVERGRKLKYFDVKKAEQVDGVWVGTEVHMKTTTGKTTLHRTVLEWIDTRFDQDLDDSLFTIRRLEKGL